MAEKPKLRPYLVRLLIVSAISLIFSAAFNEITYLMQKDEHDRAPKTVELVILPGTAERVAAGQKAPNIPEEMVFVVGDVLEVRNQDSVIHQLGPVTVPPGGTGKLVMKQAENYAYSCSFQTDKYLGIDVRPSTTWTTRVTALLLVTPTTAVLGFLYSLVAYPIKPEEQVMGGPA